MTVLRVDRVGYAVAQPRVDGLVGERGPHACDAPQQPAGIEIRELLDQGALDLLEHRRRDDRLEEPKIEGGEQEVAANDRDERVGVEDDNGDRHQS